MIQGHVWPFDTVDKPAPATVPAPHLECKKAAVAAVVEPVKGEIYVMLGEGNHDCERWLLTESLARKLRRELNAKLD